MSMVQLENKVVSKDSVDTTITSDQDLLNAKYHTKDIVEVFKDSLGNIQSNGNKCSDDSAGSTPSCDPPPDNEEGEGGGEDSDEKEQSTNRYYYSRDILMKLAKAPSSTTWPSCLNPLFNKSPGRWDPERWMRAKHDKQRPATTIATSQPTTTPATSTAPRQDRPPDIEIKRPRDPRERVKQEDQDGIVLSPQRRSFGTGCHGLQSGPSSQSGGRSESPDRPGRDSHREIQPRRIGSGRIVRREEVEIPSGPSLLGGKERNGTSGPRRDQGRDDNRRDPRDRDMEPRRDARDWRSKPNVRYDRDDGYDSQRRYFDEDDRNEKRREREREREQRDRKYHDRRRMSKPEEEDTPEWFHGGPSSQHEFIELVGFDDIPEDDGLSKANGNKKRKGGKKEKEGGSRKNSRSNTPVIPEEETPKPDEVADKTWDKSAENNNQEDNDTAGQHHQNSMARPQLPPQPTVVEPSGSDQDSIQFNIDDFLGDIIGFPGADDKSNETGSSRMKQFFGTRDSPTMNSTATSRRSSIDFTPSFNYLMGNDIPQQTGPNIVIPSPTNTPDSTHFFAPISPAENTGGKVLLDMLNRSGPEENVNHPILNVGHGSPMLVPGHGRPPVPRSVNELLMDGKGQSLEEVESSLRNASKYPGGNEPSIPHPNNYPGNMSALNDFLVKGGAKPMAKQPNENREDIFAKIVRSAKTANMKPQPNPPMGVPNIPPPNIPQLNFPQGASHPFAMVKQAPPPQVNVDNARAFGPRFIQNRPNMQQMLQAPPMPPPPQQGPPPQRNFQGHDPIEMILNNAMSQMSMGNPPQTCPIPEHIYKEALNRPDVKNLIQNVIAFRVTEDQLIGQLATGNLTPNQRSTINIALALLNIPPMGANMDQSHLHPPNLAPSPTPQNILPVLAGVNGPSLSPRVASPNPEGTNTLAPHQLHQAGLSPLMVGSESGNVARQPTHRELVALTQSIMQNALLKQQLEKAKEKHRKREVEKAKSPNPTSAANAPVPNNVMKVAQEASPNKTAAKCQSPLAFCPTSVMRELTADKDRNDKPASPSSGEASKDNIVDANQRVSLENSQPPSSAHYTSTNVQTSVPGLTANNKNLLNDIRRGASPIPSVSSAMNKDPNCMNPQVANMMNYGAVGPQRYHAPPPMPNQQNQRPPMQMPNMNAWSVANSQAQQGGFNRQMMHTQPPPNVRPPNFPNYRWMQTQYNHRPGGPVKFNMKVPNANTQMPPPNHQLSVEQNQGLRVPTPSSSNPNSQRSSPVNLVSFFGRDVIAQLQVAPVPDLPRANVMSVEEFERLQQQAVPN